MAVTLTREFLVLFVVACVALGLSIWAFAKPCKKDGFGNIEICSPTKSQRQGGGIETRKLKDGESCSCGIQRDGSNSCKFNNSKPCCYWDDKNYVNIKCENDDSELDLTNPDAYVFRCKGKYYCCCGYAWGPSSKYGCSTIDPASGLAGNCWDGSTFKIKDIPCEQVHSQ